MATVPCLCPPDQTRHPDGDTVTLRQKLDFVTATTMQKAVGLLVNDEPGVPSERLLAVLAEQYVLYGVETWTVRDAKGKPVPVTPAAVREYLLSNLEAAMTVADEADSLYAKVVLTPLLRKASSSSPPTQTSDSTSQPTGSPPEPMRRSRRSSTSTSQTDATATTSSSRDGDSSSSRNSASAA
jgi:hypothetical protein